MTSLEPMVFHPSSFNRSFNGEVSLSLTSRLIKSAGIGKKLFGTRNTLGRASLLSCPHGSDARTMLLSNSSCHFQSNKREDDGYSLAGTDAACLHRHGSNQRLLLCIYIADRHRKAESRSQIVTECQMEMKAYFGTISKSLHHMAYNLFSSSALLTVRAPASAFGRIPAPVSVRGRLPLRRNPGGRGQCRPPH